MLKIIAKKILRKNLYNFLVINFTNRKKVNSYSNKDKYKNKINKSNYMDFIFENYYKNKLQFIDDIYFENISSSYSYVPYFKENTNILIYNFFSYNYAIRDPILYQFYILKDSKISNKKYMILKQDQIVLLDKNFFQDMSTSINEGILVIEALHPKIKTRANELRYYVLYGQNNEFSSCVHSMPIRKDFAQYDYNGFRNIVPIEGNKNIIYSNQEKLFIKDFESETDNNTSRLYGKEKKAVPGFFLNINNNKVNSVWHDTYSLNDYSTSMDEDGESTLKLIFFNPNPIKFKQEVLLTKELGATFRTTKIEIFDLNLNKKLISEDIAISIPYSIDIDDKYHVDTPYYGFIHLKFNEKKLKELPKCHLQMFFIDKESKTLLDQVHSMRTVGFYNDIVINKNKSYRCRKFAPIINNADNFYVITPFGGNDKNNPSTEIEIKIKLINRKEFKMIKKIEKDKPLVFSLKELKKDLMIDDSGILIIEHERINYSALWFSYLNQNLVCDHFTGG